MSLAASRKGLRVDSGGSRGTHDQLAVGNRRIWRQQLDPSGQDADRGDNDADDRSRRRDFRVGRSAKVKVRKAGRAELGPRPKTKHSPRAVAAARRVEQLRRALNLAATQPTSHVVLIEPDGAERLSTIRAALARIMKDEPGRC